MKLMTSWFGTLWNLPFQGLFLLIDLEQSELSFYYGIDPSDNSHGPKCELLTCF